MLSPLLRYNECDLTSRSLTCAESFKWNAQTPSVVRSKLGKTFSKSATAHEVLASLVLPRGIPERDSKQLRLKRNIVNKSQVAKEKTN